MIISVCSFLLDIASGWTWSETVCRQQCDERSTPAASNYRVLSNKASDDFNGWADVWANDDASIVATNMVVRHGVYWPRFSEGVTVPPTITPGYPIDLRTYMQLDSRYISYTGQWVPRNVGPLPHIQPVGPRYNGAVIWLTNSTGYNPGTVNPKWPFTVEVNIWNRYDLGCDDVQRFRDYYDGNAKYQVYGGFVQRWTVSFFAYFVLNESQKGMGSMNINTVALLKHLRDSAGLSEDLDIIETAVAAEGHPGADGKFIAEIKSMGRP